MDEKNKKLFENSHLELPSEPTTAGVDYLGSGSILHFSIVTFSS